LIKDLRRHANSLSRSTAQASERERDREASAQDWEGAPRVLESCSRCGVESTLTFSSSEGIEVE